MKKKKKQNSTPQHPVSLPKSHFLKYANSHTFLADPGKPLGVGFREILHILFVRSDQMILTVTLSLLLSAEPSFSLGVLAVSVGVDCTLELGWDDLFNVSVLISVSVSCCVAVAKIKEKRESSRYSCAPGHESLFTGTSAPMQMKNIESLCIPPTLIPSAVKQATQSKIT